MSTYVCVHPTETETRFVEWLAKLSHGVEWKYARWMVDWDGKVYEEEDGSDFCVDCVQIQYYVNRHKKNGFTDIDGWDEYFPSDSPHWCARCHVLLCHSLTEWGVNQEIDGLEHPGAMSAGDAAIVHNFLDGIGDYQRDKHWPLIEPHAMRLMNEAASDATEK